MQSEIFVKYIGKIVSTLIIYFSLYTNAFSWCAFWDCACTYIGGIQQSGTVYSLPFSFNVRPSICACGWACNSCPFPMAACTCGYYCPCALTGDIAFNSWGGTCQMPPYGGETKTYNTLQYNSSSTSPGDCSFGNINRLPTTYECYEKIPYCYTYNYSGCFP